MVAGAGAVLIILVGAALLAASRESTRTGAGPTTTTPDTGFLPDYELDPSVGRITSDDAVSGAPGPAAIAGLDVRFLSYRDPAQGFAGPQLYVQVVRDLDPSDGRAVTYGEGDAQAEAVTVAGRPGHLTVLGTVVLLGVPPTADVPEGLLLVAYQLSEPQVLTAAESLRRAADGTWSGPPPDALALAASGTDTAPGASARTIAIEGEVALDLEVHEGDASTFEGLVRDRVAGASSVATTTVAGRPAVSVTDATGVARAILWQPTAGTVAELRGAATSAQIGAVAAALRPVHEDEWLPAARPPATTGSAAPRPTAAPTTAPTSAPPPSS